MATLPIFWATIRAPLHCLGPHEKQVKGYPAAPTTLGEHLRKRRLDLRETQAQAAARFGISSTAYNGWEGDRIVPNIAKWPDVVRFLGYDPSPSPNGFAESVRALRRRLGLDRRELARQLGVDVKSVLNWEAARTVPFSKMREKLAALEPGLPSLGVR
jgi:transcriptional regulator with XRE-family HTH domain